MLRTDVDPAQEWGDTPAEIVPIFGWGPIPDEYERGSLDEEQGE